MSKGKETRPIYLVRKGLSLVPELDMDADAISAIPHGRSVRVEIRQQRSHERLRAYWKMLSEVVAATGCAPSPEKLHEVVKLETGHVDLVRLGNGMTVAIPGSIAFDKMTETEMVGFFQAAQEWLGRQYGYVREAAA